MQQSSSETEEGVNAVDGSSEGEEGDSVEEEDNKEKLKGTDKAGSKRKKTAGSKVHTAPPPSPPPSHVTHNAPGGAQMESAGPRPEGWWIQLLHYFRVLSMFVMLLINGIVAFILQAK